MRTFAEKPKATQQATSAKSTIPRRALSGQGREVGFVPHLQRTNGNQAVPRLLPANPEGLEADFAPLASPRFGHDFSRISVHPGASTKIQQKLAVNTPGDTYEQEADRVADQVMRMREPQLQRTCACGGTCPKCQTEQPAQEHEHLQTRRLQTDDTRETASPNVHEVLRSQGQPLPPATRNLFEARFGYDFKRVRVHTDAKAAASAREVNARAYTVGHDVVFEAGQYAPGTFAGKRLIAHELAHVVQQQTESRSVDLDLSGPDGSLKKDSRQIGQPGRQREPLSRSPHPSVLQRQTPPPAPTTEDCAPWQTTMLTGHLNAARTWVDDAAQKVAAYADVFASPRHCAVPRSPATAAVVRDALTDNFHSTSSGHVLAIRDNFASLRSELNGTFTFECEDEGCDDQAYVRGAFSWVRKLGDIHVCPPWFQCRDYFRRVTTLIHERAHQYPGATDNAYEWDASYSSLTPEDAIDNAESYAVAARQIYHGGAHGPGTPAC